MKSWSRRSFVGGFSPQHNVFEIPLCSLLIIHSFLLLSSVSYVWIYHTFLAMQLLMNTWSISRFWLLCIKLLWLLVCKSSCGYMLSFLCGRYVGAELLVIRKVYVFNDFIRNCKPFFQSIYLLLYSRQQSFIVWFALGLVSLNSSHSGGGVDSLLLPC